MHADALAYVALHGTGTPLGDPIEVGALGQAAAHGKGADAAPRLSMGSVKSCYGHTEGAAGITGMLLAISVLQQQVSYAINLMTILTCQLFHGIIFQHGLDDDSLVRWNQVILCYRFTATADGAGRLAQPIQVLSGNIS